MENDARRQSGEEITNDIPVSGDIGEPDSSLDFGGNIKIEQVD